MRAAARVGAMLPFLVTYGDRVVGQMSASNIIRGALRSCSIGYWIDSRGGRTWHHADRAGLGHRSLPDRVPGCTGSRSNIRPENHASLRVVQKLGLRQEGYHERFLDIDGAWRDHLSFAITAEECLDAPVLSRLAALPVPPG